MNRLSLLAPLSLMFGLLGCPKDPPPTTPVESETSYTGALPVDPGVRQGVLPNGMHWYIEVNQEPKKRVVFRLAVDAGSILEDEDQLGLAHVVEHMAFNGSEHFEGNELIAYLESVGTQFGAHLNAHTSTDETVYKLEVPSDDPEIVDKAFLVFQDWAGGIAFDDEEIEKERGVVLEEWRGRRGANARLGDAMRPLTYHNSLYKDRNTIGTEESLLNFTPDALRRFYADWYRPELMAIVIVGDIDPDEMQAKIEAHFSELTSPQAPRERIRPDVPPHDELLISVLTDVELMQTSVQLMQKHDEAWENTHEQTLATAQKTLVYTMFNERMRDLTLSPEAPFLGAGGGAGRISPRESTANFGAGVQEGQWRTGLVALLTEIKRVRVHGFTELELSRAKINNLRAFEDYYNERNKTHSSVAADEIVRVFLTNEPMPGVEYEWEYAQVSIPKITLEQINTYASDIWVPQDSRIVTISMPEKDGLQPPSEDDVRAVVAEVEAATVAPPTSEQALPAMLGALPPPGTIVKRETIDELGVTIWTLSNGVKVWIKPTDFKTDEVGMASFSPGGFASVSDDEWVVASTASHLMRQSGLGALNATQVNKYLSGKQASVSPWISSRNEGIQGAASPKNLTDLLELVHGVFTAPRFDQDAFDVDQKVRVERLKNRLSDPDANYFDRFNALTWGDHIRHQPWTEATLQQMDLDASEVFFKERFADASDFTFVFVGNVDLETFEGPVNTYLASLPNLGRSDAPGDDGARRAKGIHSEIVRAGLADKARFGVEFHGDFENTWTSRNRLFALRDALSTALREALREDLGGVYGVGVSASSTAEPVSEYTFSIGFQCDPERVQELEEATFKVLNHVIENGLDEHYVDDIKEKNRRSREVDVRTNEFWLGGIAGSLQSGRDPLMMLSYAERNESLSAKALHEAAKKHLNMEQFVKVVLLPEEAE